ncbi:beta-lactamase/transpeptidase-like protein [Mycena belliarum]|uniref:Beta-lactamase/transpeptidase-like protein n=1 Tax=Mycena belliarum TaxID=1033014 RepID=A0AAD6UAY5_9AGAR|nr:beta-lactamase/transpeptidase-like protein [Mycena belliae]
MISLSDEQKSALRGIMSRAVESQTVPALFCGVTDQNGEIFMHQEGRKVVDDPTSAPLDEDAIFWVCSQTKLVTSIAALQLLEQGKIQLSTPVSQILPELANPVIVTASDAGGKPTATTPAKTPITFGQLLNHTSGMVYNLDGAPYGSFPTATNHIYSKDDDYTAFCRVSKGSFPGELLKFEPGSDWGYGFSADYVGFIVERLSGKSLEQYFKDHIFAPLGITSASFYLTPDLKERMLTMSVRNSEGKVTRHTNSPNEPQLMNQDPEKTNMHFGGVGLFSSLKDYLALLRHLLQTQAGTAVNPILKDASVAALFEPTLNTSGASSLANMFHQPEGSVQFSNGLMVSTVDVPGRRKKGSGGWGGWACTSYVIDPATGIAAVFGTQLAPAEGFDMTYTMLWVEVEAAIYAGLEAGGPTGP